METVYDKTTMDVCYTCKNECKKANGIVDNACSCKEHNFKDFVEHIDALEYSDLVMRIAYESWMDPYL